MNEKLFIDTDLGGDCDDVGAIALANIFQSKGFIDIVGMTHTTSIASGAGCIALTNEYYGNRDIVIGATRRENYCAFDTRQYATKMLKALGNPNNTRDRYPDSIQVMRSALASAEDGSVTMVFIGPLGNASDLLDSPADQISALTGVELVAAKVKKFVIMGGLFREKNEKIFFGGAEYGAEFNIVCDIKSAQNVVKKCPVDIVFSDFKVGYQICTGSKLLLQEDMTNPITFAYTVFCNRPRESWDLLAVWYAALGCDDFFRLSNPGCVEIADDGETTFAELENGKHYYLKINNSIDYMVGKIDNTLYCSQTT